jgi:hypothetical protein
MENTFGTYYIEDVSRQFRKLKALVDSAVSQISDEQVFDRLGEEDNSIAVIIKHLSGNMRSRWTDFLTSDGEKPDRNRDGEFEIDGSETRTEIMKQWEAGWHCLFDVLRSLTPDDLGRTVLIRSEPHSVVKAINRELSHYAYHVGQIVFLTKHFKSRDWNWLSVPRGKSEEFNEEMRRKYGGQP